MSREIKFRAKRLDNNQWVIGYYLPTQYGEKHFIYFALEFLNEHTRIEIDIKTLGQYTGFVDINGIKIFEGDVVHISGIGNYEITDICQDFDMLVNAKVEGDLNEIVGNIYEHKELITEVKNG